jgi:uncharacterized ferritin-like protein (DUF455 family)
MQFYEALHHAITSSTLKDKEKLTLQALAYCNQNKVINSSHTPKVFSQPSYASFCTVVDPKTLPSRKELDSPRGLATLIHAIAHIEYSAIDLALDAVYRYPQMPMEYKIDWLVVAEDEIRHFKMLVSLLKELGYHYGDFPVHAGLFEASVHTAHSPLYRMAVIPRYYEASGLDVNPQIIKKLESKRHKPHIAQLISTLETIYHEEIEHVTKGDKWFKYLCKKHHVEESIYFEILEEYALLKKHRPHINIEARKEAGFTCSEIKKLGAKACH